MTHIIPPPWQLSGNGLVLLFRFPRRCIEPWLQPKLRGAFVGGIGAVMCVDYHTSNCGPYRELLLIPGAFWLRGQLVFNISTIYVSTQVSLASGQANWGIPKQQAEFTVAPGFDSFGVAHEGRTFFHIEAHGRGPLLPADTRWLLFRPALLQPWAGQWLRTKPAGRGAVQLARIPHIHVDSTLFPDISQLRPLAALLVRGFELHFPLPEQA